MQIIEPLLTSLNELSLYLFDPNQRIFLVYLLGSFLLAVPVFWLKTRSKSPLGFLNYIFPKKIWFAPSARQDYVMLVVNKMIRGVLLTPIILTMVPIALSVTHVLEELFGPTLYLSDSKALIMFSFTLMLFILDDLSRFLLHWLLHNVPFLWEFHKVHHSAKVLTPITIYRSHPIENYLFACRLALAQGLAIGLAYYCFGPLLSVIEIAGANIFVFVFNFMGSNLRHSHVWLSWGEKIERWFISPAQHQIHHSDNPIHFDRNLGSALAIWDRMAGTLITAKETDKINFGVGQDFNEHNTLIGIYLNPFKSSWKQISSIFKVSLKEKK